MSKIPGIRRLFRLPSSRRSMEHDIEDEIEFHLASREAELEAEGLTPEEARRRARLRFGDLAAARRDLMAVGEQRLRREQWRDRWEAIAYEVRLAARGLLRARGFTAAVVLTLALGIGVNAAMFGITDRLLLSPPPHVEDADELVRVFYESTPPWVGELTVESVMPYADYVVQRDEVRAFESVAAYSVPGRSVLGGGDDGMEIRVVGVTPGYFSLLGVEPAFGRYFAKAEGAEPNGERVVVLSHDLWRTRFGGDTSVLDRQVEIDNRRFTVIGVAPLGFHGIDLEPVHAWVPMGATSMAAGTPEWHTTRAMAWVRLIARLVPGVSAASAADEATAAYLSPEDYQVRYEGDPTARVVLGSVIAARAPAVGLGTPQRSGRIALWLFGVSSIVLLIACANVANLMVARGIRRRREIGVRMALGIGRRRLVGQVMTEAVLLSVLGAGLGLLLAHWGGQLTRTLLLPELDWTTSPVDQRVLLFAGLAAVLTACLTGLFPALHAARADVVALLAQGGRTASYRRSPVRGGLVLAQAALSVVLLVGAGLFVRSLHNARSVPLGYEPDRVALLQWHRTGLDWATERVHEVYETSLERVRALPGVEAAGLSMNAPMWSAAGASIRVPGRDSVPRPPGMFGYMYDVVSPDYFRALGTPILRGRAFTEMDGAGDAPVAIVTESLARLVWPREDPIGKCIVHLRGDDAPCREVVGVVESLRYRNVEGDPDVMFFLPIAQGPRFAMRVLTVRTRDDPARAIGEIRRDLQALEPGLPHLQATLLRDRIDPQLQPWRLGASLFSAFGVLALLLAGLGLYGVVAYDVTQRTREVGLRMALGAKARNVAVMVLADACRLVALGVVAGVTIAAWAAPRAEALLFEVAPRDALVFAGAATMLLLVGFSAALLPGWRAVRVQPSEALREE